MIYLCDDLRHLVCHPYSVENLHKMAEDLNIKRCWFHSKKDYWHYDIPKRRIEEIQSKCQIITPQELLQVINKTWQETSISK